MVCHRLAKFVVVEIQLKGQVTITIGALQGKSPFYQVWLP